VQDGLDFGASKKEKNETLEEGPAKTTIGGGGAAATRGNGKCEIV